MRKNEMTDEQLLTRLLNSKKLDAREEAAFKDMLDRLLASRKGIKLSPAQRQWANTVYEKSIDVEATVKKQVKVYDFERMPKPLKPPE